MANIQNLLIDFSTNDNKKYSIIIIVVIAALVFSWSIMTLNLSVIPVIFSIIIFYAVFLKWEIMLVIFIVLYPIYQNLPFLEIGFMDLNKFILIGLIISYFFNYGFNFNKLDKHKKRILWLFIFWYLVYNQFYYMKGIIFGYKPNDEQYLVQLIYWIFSSSACYLIISKDNEIKIRKSIEIALIVGTVVLSLSTFFAENLMNFNIVISTVTEVTRQEVIRTSGLYAGHPTQFSAFMSIMFGYFFAIYNKKKKIKDKLFYIMIILIIMSSFIMNSSRVGILGCIGIVLYSFISERNPKKLFFQGFIWIAVLLLIYYFGDVIIYRMSKEQFMPQFKNSRLYLITYHLNEIIQHPEYILFGTLKPYFINTHNSYLEVLYRSGIFLFVWFLLIIYKIYKNKKNHNFDITYPLLGFLIPFAGNNNPVELYFILVLSLAHSPEKTNEHENRKKN